MGDILDKIFKLIGFILLIGLSFIYTEKTVSVVKEYDEIMVQIKEELKNFETSGVDATINDKTIIPGIMGKTIDINRSYSKMKQYGKFNSGLFVYKKKNPTISLGDHLDNYIISGNNTKNMVSLIFLVTKNINIEKIVKIMNDNNIEANFFIDSVWLENNNDLLLELIKSKHVIGNLSYNGDYKNSSFNWIDKVIKKVGKQGFSYCYMESPNEEYLNICNSVKDYTIMPSIIVRENPLVEVKKSIKAGSIISFKINDKLEEELGLIIRYIKSRGYSITNLKEHLSE